MKSVIKHLKINQLPKLIFVFIFSSFIGFAQNGNYNNGKKLFNANCAACHRLDKKLIGPPLANITEKKSVDWLKLWIKDNNALRASGDADAKAIFEEYKGMPMTPFPQLSDQDIVDILTYTKGKPKTTETASTVQKVDPAVARGKKLFKANCTACHKLDKKLIGPALYKIGEKRSLEWLKLWIKDNNALRASGDADAKAIFEEFKGMPMTPFPQLTDENIEDIVKYLNVGDVKPVVAKTAVSTTDPRFNKPVTSVSTSLLLTILSFIVLSFIIAATTKKSKEESEEPAMLITLLKNPFLRFLAVIFVLLAVAYYAYGAMLNVDMNEGYQPIQPIHFSHKVHAGANKIDCQYCHSSAKHSKTSGIPSVNVCMNCHKGISEYNGALFGGYSKADLDGEIQKIYDAIGWDKDNLKYKENYKQKPIKWVRIHNLPDFAYFNHSQHVTVAGVACQKCHGPIETMDEVKQASKLTMGWCIECHKTTEVKMEGNGYYKNIHDQLSKKYGVEKVTEAQMGGQECGKCHY
ncbi:MAG: c-type cytochrome [Lutibacter sp.]